MKARVTNKISKEKYTIKFNFTTMTATVFDEYEDAVAYRYGSEDDNVDDFVKRVKKEIKEDEDL